MKIFLRAVSFAGLILVLLPAVLTFSGQMAFDTAKAWMMAGTIVWFATAVFWLGKKTQAKEGK